MATIEKTTVEFGDDGLLVEFDVAHPVHEAGVWFTDTVIVVSQQDHRRETISHDRQVEAGITERTPFRVTTPPIAVDRARAPLTVMIRTSPRAPSGDRADPIIVEVPS